MAKLHKVFLSLRDSSQLRVELDFISDRASSLTLQWPQVSWCHPSYKSILFTDVLPRDVLERAMQSIPDVVYPTGCSTRGEVVQRIVSTGYWDNIMYLGSKGRLCSLNHSKVGSPRQKNYSLLAGSSTDAVGCTMNELFYYPRNYVPPSDFTMSIMPEPLSELCKVVYDVLRPILSPRSLAFGPFNAVQVRGYLLRGFLAPCGVAHRQRVTSQGWACWEW
jgi:hypothetical protein